jgi:hypothetical protein
MSDLPEVRTGVMRIVEESPLHRTDCVSNS